MRIPCLIALAIAAGFSTTAATGHEFWIDPHEFQIAPGENIVADLRVGQGFTGVAFSYLPPKFRLFDIVRGDQREAVSMRMGDRPAMDVPALGNGLNVVLHVTTDQRITWSDPEKFRSFVRHKGAAWVLDEHARRGLPDSGFSEFYSRYAKSLIAVGDGAGEDARFGLLTEIVLLENPYTDNMSDGIDLQVFYDGAPRRDAQIEVFARSGETVEKTTVPADGNGRATVPVRPGVVYLLDAVVLRAIEPAFETGPVWESLWASTTFRVPAN